MGNMLKIMCVTMAYVTGRGGYRRRPGASGWVAVPSRDRPDQRRYRRRRCNCKQLRGSHPREPDPARNRAARKCAARVRWDWDSNPGSREATCFQGRRNGPLCHPTTDRGVEAARLMGVGVDRVPGRRRSRSRRRCAPIRRLLNAVPSTVSTGDPRTDRSIELLAICQEHPARYRGWN